MTKEQFEIYGHIDTTFELCKICSSREKSVRIDPCGHLLCQPCLQSWISSSANQQGEATCPFCRNKVSVCV